MDEKNSLMNLSKTFLNRKSQNDITKDIVQKIIDGEIDPLQVEVNLKALENIISTIRKNEQVKELIIEEADKYEGKVFDRFGAKITITQRTTWDYKNDLVWKKMKEDVNKRELFLKNLQKDMVDPETGEMATKPEYKISRFLKIEFE